MEESELPPALSGDDGGRARTKAAVVDAGDSGVVVGELIAEFGRGERGELGLFVGRVVICVCGGVVEVEEVSAWVLLGRGHGGSCWG